MVNIAPFDGTMPTLHTDDQIQQHIASLDANHPPVIIEHAIVGDGTFFLFWGRLTQPATSKHWTLHHFQLIENKTADTASFFTNTGCERLSVERTDKTLALVATRPTKASTTDYILHVKLELSKHFNNRPTTSSSSSSKRPSLFAHKTLDQILKSKSVFALMDHICDKNNTHKEDFFRLQPTIRDFFFTSHNNTYCNKNAKPCGFPVLVQQNLDRNVFGCTKEKVAKTRQRRNNKNQSSVKKKPPKQQDLSRWIKPQHDKTNH